MKSTKELEAEFRAKFNALLLEYGATMEADDHYDGYPECGQDIQVIITIPSIFDGESQREFCKFDLGNFVTGVKPVESTPATAGKGG